VTRPAVLAVVALGCGRSASAPAPERRAPPPVCAIQDRVLAAHVACRTGRLRKNEELHRGDVIALRQETLDEGNLRSAARMCAFGYEHEVAELVGEGCAFAPTAAERAMIAQVEADVTRAPRGATPETTALMARIAGIRDRTCGCTAKACVDALDREENALPLESLQHESQAVHDAIDAMHVEMYDCATRPRILRPDVKLP
jgi:hypothetical protein